MERPESECGTDGSQLFSPLTLREVTLPNRVMISPMCMYSAQEGKVNDFHLVHLGRYALGGAGSVAPSEKITWRLGRPRSTPGGGSQAAA